MIGVLARWRRASPGPAASPALPWDGPLSGWLGVALTLAMLPHLTRLPPWLGGVFLVALLWRGLAARGRLPLPHRLLLLPITLGVGAGVLVGFGTVFGREAGVALLAAMTALKILEARSRRDGLVLVLLGYLLVMANLLSTQNLIACVHLLGVVLVLCAAQTAVVSPGVLAAPRELLRFCARLLALSAPFMVVLFLLFPRLPGPLWNLPKDATSGRTGLSEEMSPGDISRLSLSGAVAFRVSFEGEAPPQEQLYWRGPVLWLFDGRTWTRPTERAAGGLEYRALGESVDYVVTLEPHGRRWLFALDLPARVPKNTVVSTDFQLLRREPVDEVLRYPMRSYPSHATGPLRPWERRMALQLPKVGNPKARELAARWREQDPDPATLAAKALAAFHDQPFHYTLTPPLLIGADSVDEFLFQSRQGFCEHYAGSFVFLMRAAGVPARVVTGYQGGERNTLGDYWIVRQADAHAWAEVWLPEMGWTRVDPTAAVAPERVGRGLFAALSDPAEVSFLARRGESWLRRLALGWDAVNNAWNQWVLAYGSERQQRLLAGLGLAALGGAGLVAALLAGLGAVGLVLAGLWLWRQRRGADPVTRAWKRFCARLARRGLARQAHEGPVDFVERVAKARPDLAERARTIGRLYAQLRYGLGGKAEQVRLLRGLVAKFKA